MNCAAGVIVLDPAGNVLLLERADGSGWGLPGGKMEEGETFAQTAARETLEETGIPVTALEPVSTIVNADGWVFCTFMTQLADTPVVTCDETESCKYGWFAPSELPAPLFMNTGELVQRALMPAVMDGDDINGWLNVADNPISTVGVFPYLGKNIKMPAGADQPQADKIYYVYRPAEELSDPATLESFKLLPWIDDHLMLGADATPAEEKGVGGVTGQDVYFKDDSIYANLKLFSARHRANLDGGKKELSAAYRCLFEHAPGTFKGQPYEYIQRKIRGNHLASVQEGRMGPMVAVMDGQFSFEVNMDKDEVKESEVKDADDTAEAPASEASIGDVAKQLSVLLPVLGKLMALVKGDDVEEKTEVVDEDEKAVVPAAAVMDHAEITRRVSSELAARDRLAGKVSEFVGVFDHSEMTRSQVVEYGISKLELSGAAPKTGRAEFLQGVLAVKQSPKAVPSFAMDAADTPSALPAFLDGYKVK